MTTLWTCCENLSAAWASPPVAKRGIPCLRPASPTAPRHFSTSTATCAQERPGNLVHPPPGTSCTPLTTRVPSHGAAQLCGMLKSAGTTVQAMVVRDTLYMRFLLAIGAIQSPCHVSPLRAHSCHLPMHEEPRHNRTAYFRNKYHQMSAVHCHYLSRMLTTAEGLHTSPPRKLCRECPVATALRLAFFPQGLQVVLPGPAYVFRGIVVRGSLSLQPAMCQRVSAT
jgi:hypothetical protein